MSDYPHRNKREAHSDRLQERIAHANEIANSAAQIRDFVTARCIQQLSSAGRSQREIAKQLGVGEPTVNRLANAPVTYTPEGGPAATVCDAVEEAAWEASAAMRESYIALTGSHTTCPRCGDTQDASSINFCSRCRFPLGDTYRPPAVPTKGNSIERRADSNVWGP